MALICYCLLFGLFSHSLAFVCGLIFRKQPFGCIAKSLSNIYIVFILKAQAPAFGSNDAGLSEEEAQG